MPEQERPHRYSGRLPAGAANRDKTVPRTGVPHTVVSPEVRTRADLVGLIARAIRCSLSYVDERRARAAADTVLRELKSAGIAIFRRR